MNERKGPAFDEDLCKIMYLPGVDENRVRLWSSGIRQVPSMTESVNTAYLVSLCSQQGKTIQSGQAANVSKNPGLEEPKTRCWRGSTANDWYKIWGTLGG